MAGRKTQEYFIDEYTDALLEEMEKCQDETECERVRAERHQQYLQDLIELESKDRHKKTRPFEAYTRTSSASMLGFDDPTPSASRSYNQYLQKEGKKETRTLKQIQRSLAEKKRNLDVTTNILNRMMKATHDYHHKRYLAELALPTQHSCTSVMGQHETLSHLTDSAARHVVSGPECIPSRKEEPQSMFNQSFSEYDFGQQTHFFDDEYWENLTAESSLVKDDDVLEYLRMTMSLGIKNNKASTDFQDFVISQLRYREKLPKHTRRKVMSDSEFDEMVANMRMCDDPYDMYSDDVSATSSCLKSLNVNTGRGKRACALDEDDLFGTQDDNSSVIYDNLKTFVEFASGVHVNDRDCKMQHSYNHKEFSVDIKFDQQVNEHTYQNDVSCSLDHHMNRETTLEIRMTENVFERVFAKHATSSPDEREQKTNKMGVPCDLDVCPPHGRSCLNDRDQQNTSTDVSCAKELDDLDDCGESCFGLYRQDKHKTLMNISSASEIDNLLDSQHSSDSLADQEKKVIVIFPLPVEEPAHDEDSDSKSLQAQRASLDKETEALINKIESTLVSVDLLCNVTNDFLFALESVLMDRTH